MFTELKCLFKTTFLYNVDLEYLPSERKLWSAISYNGALAIWSFIKWCIIQICIKSICAEIYQFCNINKIQSQEDYVKQCSTLFSIGLSSFEELPRKSTHATVYQYACTNLRKITRITVASNSPSEKLISHYVHVCDDRSFDITSIVCNLFDKLFSKWPTFIVNNCQLW